MSPVVKDTRPKTKHIIVGISRNNQYMQEGPMPAMAVDEILSNYINDGYELIKVIYLGEAPDFYQMMYVLVLK